jgi:hypothetical protein
LKENLSLWKEEDGDNAVEDLWAWYPSANESYIYKTWEDPFFIDRIVQFYYLYLDDHLFRLKYETNCKYPFQFNFKNLLP